MDKYQVDHRDRVLRAYFSGRDWDKNDEYLLKQHFILHSAQLLPKYLYLVEDEWEVEPGQANEGKGDLVFADKNGYFAVVEFKYIDLNRTGSTIRATRNEKRKTVKKQAVKYARFYANLYHSKVEAFYFTSEDNLPVSLGIY